LLLCSNQLLRFVALPGEFDFGRQYVSVAGAPRTLLPQGIAVALLVLAPTAAGARGVSTDFRHIHEIKTLKKRFKIDD
jgi:hypothetical protein